MFFGKIVNVVQTGGEEGTGTSRLIQGGDGGPTKA